MKDLTAIRRDWAGRGYSCEIWTDPPGTVWTDYVHGVDELFMVSEGVEEITMRGRTVRLAVGEEVFIPAGVTHTVRNVGGTTSRWLYGYRRKQGPVKKC